MQDLAPLLIAAFVPLVEVNTTSVCPGAAEVAVRLRALLPGAITEAEPDRLYLERQGTNLVIHLLAPDGSVLGSSRVPAQAPCPDLVEAVAVMVALWEGEFRPGLVPAPRLPKAVPVVGATAAPAAVPRFTWDLGMGAAGKWTVSRMAPGLSLETSVAPRARSVGLALGILGDWPQREALAGGRAHWTRLSLWAGPRYRIDRQRWTVDIDAGVAATLLWAHGEAFIENRSQFALSPGVVAGVRLSRWRGRLGGWVAVTGWSYRGRLLAVEDSDQQLRLGTGGLQVGVGASFRVLP